MNRLITSRDSDERVEDRALASMSASFERFCLASGIEALAEMMEADARDACGRAMRAARRQAHRWGKTKGKLGFHAARWRSNVPASRL